MQEETPFQYSNKIWQIPLFVLLVMWFVYWVEIRFSLNFTRFGILPRTLSGLKGIFFSPFIHANTKHLFNNSIPIILFLGLLLYFYRTIAGQILAFGFILTGFFTWLIGGEGYHIGMSGIVYLLFSFIFFSGVIKMYFRLVAVSLVLIFFYGSMFWYVFPIEEKISWEGHLSGLLVGLVFAYVYRNKGPQKKAYVFKKTAFDLLFDEEGNYNPPAVEEDNEEGEDFSS